jgi:integrase
MGSWFCVSRLGRSKSGAWKSRKRLPEDVRLEYQRLYGPGWEVKLTIPADTPPEKAKARHAAWLAEVEGRVATLRASKRGKGQDLSQREADALAGDWYRWFVGRHHDNPGSPKRWSGLRETLLEIAGDPETCEADFGEPEVLEKVDTEARASQFLTDRGIVLTEAWRTSFLSAVASEFLQAAETLKRRASGDWSEDKHLDRLAPFTVAAALPEACPSTQPASASSSGVGQMPSAVALFEAYCLDKKPAASTMNRWRVVFTTLDAIPPEEAVHNPEGAQRWLDALRTEDRSARTVRDIWLSAARTVFKWAVRKRRVPANPFEGCTVELPRVIQTRETEREFTEAEAQTILRAALRVEIPNAKQATGARNASSPKGAEWSAAKRWVPWLCAYTGARVGELTQLRVQDIEYRTSNPKGPLGGAEYPVLRITPEAGTVKTGRVRVVPIHAHLIEQGLLEYVGVVKARLGPAGPLFFRPPARPSRNPNYRGPAVKARERLAGWVRELGVDDPAVAPNHGWRHAFKRRAARADIESRIRDAVCGHAPRTQAERYELPTVEDMAGALITFPRWEV